MKALIGCEESQAVCMEFRKRGHEAYSNDLQDCSGPHPEWHIKGDCREVIISKKWDLIILHCPCTYTALCGNRWYYQSLLRKEGVEFTKEVYLLALSVCDKVVLEQPKTIMGKHIGKCSQKIQPWQFGHGEVKETWLWVNGLPLLKPTNIVSGREQRIFKMPPSEDRGKLRSKTYQGIAEAMAEQWSKPYSAGTLF
jgi:hypothetical protein